MDTQHQTDVHKTDIQGKSITIEHINPCYGPEERESVKKDIESRLYAIFSKYSAWIIGATGL